MAKIAARQQQKKPSFTDGSSLTESQRQEVEGLAYRFFVERGCEHGFDQEDWLRAEAIIRKRRA